MAELKLYAMKATFDEIINHGGENTAMPVSPVARALWLTTARAVKPADLSICGGWGLHASMYAVVYAALLDLSIRASKSRLGIASMAEDMSAYVKIDWS